VLVDDAGTRWTVGEVCASPAESARLRAALEPPPMTPDWRPGGWLVFRSAAGEEWRLPLPPSWRELPDPALRALLAAARLSAA
jgi:hypothetical protein